MVFSVAGGVTEMSQDRLSAKLVRLTLAAIVATASGLGCGEDGSHRSGVADETRDGSPDGMGGAQGTGGGGSGGVADAAAGTSGDASVDAIVLDASSLDVSTDGMPIDDAAEADGPCEVSVESGTCMPCPTPFITCSDIDTSPAALAALFDSASGVLTIRIRTDSQTAAIQSATAAWKDAILGTTIATYDANVSSHAISLEVGNTSAVFNGSAFDCMVKDRCGQTSAFRMTLTHDSQGPLVTCP
jgi:hypothetical protein